MNGFWYNGLPLIFHLIGLLSNSILHLAKLNKPVVFYQTRTDKICETKMILFQDFDPYSGYKGERTELFMGQFAIFL